MYSRNLVPLFALVTVFATDSRGNIIGEGVAMFCDEPEWVAAVGEPITSITFTGYPNNTWITSQFAHLGLVLPTADDQTSGPDHDAYLDGWGLSSGPDGVIELIFEEPMSAIAVDHPGSVRLDLYAGDQHIGFICSFGSGGGWFGGLISKVPFDRVVITDHVVFAPHIDDLHFGPRVSWHGDVNRDGTVDLADILEVLDRWGACPINDDCIGDETGDGVVGVEDLVEVILNWS